MRKGHSLSALPPYLSDTNTLFFIHLSTMSSIYYQQGEWMELSKEVQSGPFFEVHALLDLYMGTGAAWFLSSTVWLH